MLSIVARNLMIETQRCDQRTSPVVAARRRHFGAIEHASNARIVADARQHAYGVHNILREVTVALAPSTPWQPQRSMLPSLPMDTQDNFTGLLVDIHDDLTDQGT